MATSDETKPTKSKSTSQKPPKLKVDTSASTPETSPAPKSFDISSPVSAPVVSEPVISAPVITEPVEEDKPIITTTNKNLTEQEKELITEEQPVVKNKVQKLMPESVIQRVEHKKGKSQEVILSIIILLAVGFGGYQGYLWHQSRQNPTTQVQSSAIVPAKINPVPETTTIATSTTASTTPTITPSTTPTSAVAPTVNKLKIKNTPTGYLNVRNQPSTSAKLVTQIHPGETYPYTDKKTGWFKISLTDGSSGWISSEYASVQ